MRSHHRWREEEEEEQEEEPGDTEKRRRTQSRRQENRQEVRKCERGSQRGRYVCDTVINKLNLQRILRRKRINNNIKCLISTLISAVCCAHRFHRREDLSSFMSPWQQVSNEREMDHSVVFFCESAQ